MKTITRRLKHDQKVLNSFINLGFLTPISEHEQKSSSLIKLKDTDYLKITYEPGLQDHQHFLGNLGMIEFNGKYYSITDYVNLILDYDDELEGGLL